jgi:uncharacterized repeat protein (TIGR03803 family)
MASSVCTSSSRRISRTLAGACILALLSSLPAAAQFQQVHIFTGQGGSPDGGVVRDGDGRLYGTTTWGGRWGLGSVFRLTPQPGGTFAVVTLVSFDGDNGSGPTAAPVVGTDGALYGTTIGGGVYGFGTVYRLSLTGTLTTLHAFAGPTGKIPVARLLLANDGTLYGTASAGGSSTACGDCGTIFKIPPAGVFTLVHSFAGTDGWDPSSPLVEARDGNIYGTTTDGGGAGRGTIFRLTPAGVLTTIHEFALTEGMTPNGLVQSDDGLLYGTTRGGGVYAVGTLFAIDLGGNVIHEWSFNGATGSGSSAGLTRHPDGALYGVGRFEGPSTGAGLSYGTVFRLSGGTITALHTFTLSDGAEPLAPLAIAPDGTIYGSTSKGGSRGGGTVFSLTTAGLLTTLTDFGFADGAHPQAGLTVGSDASLYGVTADGGVRSGVVFQIDGTGAFNVVHRFDFSGDQGMLPNSALVLGADDMLYGTTHQGGTDSVGVVFSVAPDGRVSVVHDFTQADGGLPRNLIRASDGNLYGTTVIGGSQSRGTVFRITPSGAFNTVHTFAGPDGDMPSEGVVEGADGLLYGTTQSGGSTNGGVVFRLDPSVDSITTLYTFPDEVFYNTSRSLLRASNGAIYLTTWESGVASVSRLESNGALTPLVPYLSFPSGLIEGHDGLFYGTTHGGGSSGAGTVFQMHPDGTVNVLHSFEGSYWSGPFGRLLQMPDGTFYGTTYGDGDLNAGTVFRIAALPSQLALSSASGPYGGTATLTAALTADGLTAAGKTISFTVNGNIVGAAVTDGAGVAILPGVSLGGLEVGAYPTAVEAAFAGDDGFAAATAEGSLSVLKRPSVLTWAAPAAIPYGLPLGAAQLNATASVPGTFTYTPAAGTVLPPGAAQVLSVTFVPIHSAHYLEAAAMVLIDVIGPPTISGVTADVPLPAVAGTTITWTAAAQGGLAPLQYQFWRLDGSTWTIVRDYASSATYSWTTTASDVGSHALQVWVRSAGSPRSYDAWSGFGFFTIDPTPPVVITSFGSYSTFPTPAGWPITWTASATGGIAPLLYKFWLYCSSTGAWTVVQDYGVAHGFTMTPAAADTCAVQVWVRSSGSTGNYEAWQSSGMFSITAIAPVAVTSLVPNVPPPFLAGVPIRWTAAATGGTAPLSYKFWLYRSSTNAWSVLRDYATLDSVTYTPMAGETQAIQVWVRSGGSTSAYEAWRSSGTFVVTPAPALRVTGLTSVPSPPASAGIPITWTASTAGGIAPIQYQFWLNQGGSWGLLRDYSLQDSVTWTPPAAGSYAVQVWVRSAGSTAQYDAWATSGVFAVGGPAPPVITSLTSDYSAPFTVGTHVTWSATATGGMAPLEYKFWLYAANTGRWVILKEYSVPNTTTWTPIESGLYAIQVWVRSAGSTANYEAWLGTAYFGVTSGPIVISTLTADVPLPASIDQPIVWTATASGGIAPLQYQFWLLDTAVARWFPLGDYSPVNTVTWTPRFPGLYDIQVRARSPGSTVAYEAQKFFGAFYITP